jgi:hypothetical protein
MHREYQWDTPVENMHLEDKRRWKNNIKMDLRRNGCEDGRWSRI